MHILEIDPAHLSENSLAKNEHTTAWNVSKFESAVESIGRPRPCSAIVRGVNHPVST